MTYDSYANGWSKTTAGIQCWVRLHQYNTMGDIFVSTGLGRKLGGEVRLIRLHIIDDLHGARCLIGMRSITCMLVFALGQPRSLRLRIFGSTYRFSVTYIYIPLSLLRLHLFYTMLPPRMAVPTRNRLIDRLPKNNGAQASQT
ncbi:uncharacterized protein F4817DRAFT_247441 [Daldinia loculata]|uniref:uncharacterized protein n=1 Tax=Daldinia loculata TaxID=103429 RepID=UPI0020C45BB8|nr:uncharacterized protein F4817DRAFT_247441 [Daldinia loculata]KAI1643698.1 hypothetical protein F4817DRAFT_247441 [Daldinia loculata]